MKKRVVRNAKFPRLRELREDLDLEVAEIAAKLGGKPSISTVYRVEQGQAIRSRPRTQNIRPTECRR
jgi:transcriptional regulator with XRE-family HTH domain